jgi:ABC-2 type transport system ATP-binding protein
MSTDASTAAVLLEHVSVRYGRAAALQDVSAIFPQGAVGLLGPNGAGKSTMLRCLLGFVAPTDGRMRVLGLDVRTSALAIRGRIGYMPETDAHIPGMSAVTFVAYCGELAGLPRADAMQRAHEVLHYVGLGEARYRNVETYSTGMKQRIKLAQALVHDPDLLFLDEPTNGMDPKGRDEMLALVRDIAHNKGLSLIVSSHLLPDVDNGRVAAQGPIDALKGHGERVFELRVKGDDGRFLAALRAAGLECYSGDDENMRVFVPDGYSARDLFQLAAHHGVQVRHLRPSVPTLEDVFARAVGEADSSPGLRTGD